MRLGAHVSVAGGKHKAFERGQKLECECLQIFIRNVRSWVSAPLKENDVNKFLEKKKQLKQDIWPILTHNSYLINLAGTDPVKLKKSYDAMLDELQKAEQLQLEYVNIHPGNKDEGEEVEAALIRIAEQLNKLIQETKGSNVRILLETTAGQGNDVGHEFEHMKFIIDEVSDKERIGVCLDTAHSFAAGYDISSSETYEEVWKDFDEIIGLESLFAFHLNDTEKECGSNVDRHAHIGEGNIGKEGFELLVNDPRFKELPGILETPKGEDMYEKNLNVLRNLRER